jgi:ribonuclease HII
LRRSKPAVREELALRIQQRSIACALGWADACEVDAINILQATMLAMRRAMLGLSCAPAHVIVDGDRCPSLAGLPFDCSIEAVVAGDSSVTCVGAASILAKVARDRFMCELDARYPGYGFAGHKGYGTPEHLQALRRLGPSPVHRRSFAPVQSCLPR